ncbi:hypothetical protein AAFL38_20315 [Klebsiella grimontii]|jgi:hypothetical protein|uniref:Uncharacterized protein n=1 Tax=Klebsiella grimontii TaxID=2058152 RepID=A0ABU9P678_9ENTR|nr:MULTISPECIES: hypothetical protein [Enterobacteriaceae]ELI8802688.1 hypothetical protein [Klebsiella michiganensis]HAU8265909.1 hypothetical protein [Kluyvera intermedia]MBM3069714.1 hypothetical protein [Lelliottia sp. RWM.1]MCJ1814489.1 hypothetical protein [Klebsiella quasipneumoniae subsp. similipneumoniae]MCJ1844868.1 hypothetical protein [Klebsiella quasipneumoniae subsp. similipneumoniae]
MMSIAELISRIIEQEIAAGAIYIENHPVFGTVLFADQATYDHAMANIHKTKSNQHRN